MSSPTKSNIASRYLETLSNGSPTNPSTPRKALASSFADNIPRLSSPRTQDDPFRDTPRSRTPSPVRSEVHKENLQNLSPIKRMILEREMAAANNKGSQPLFPSTSPIRSRRPSQIPSSPTKTNLHSFTQPLNMKKRGERNQTKTMSRITSAASKQGMSQSPSLKNLNKLNAIETRLRNPSARTPSDGEHASNVDGMSNRVKLTKNMSKAVASSMSPGKWMETDRKSLQTYEYLCRITEAKIWLENCINERIVLKNQDSEESIVEFQDYLRSGVVLAKLTQHFAPSLVKRIYYGNSNSLSFKQNSGFQFKFTENINYFFEFLETVDLPELFRFELTDLYDLKNFPKVVFCLHALSFMLATQNRAPKMERLSGKIDFSAEEVEAMDLKLRGMKLPNFDNIDEGSSVESPVAESQIASTVVDSPVVSFPTLGSSVLDTVNHTSLGIESVDTDPVDDLVSREIQEKYEKMALEEDLFDLPSPLGTPLASPQKPFSFSFFSPFDPLPDCSEITELQALARGALLRYQFFVDKYMFRAHQKEIIHLQSIIRGKQLRALRKTILFNLQQNERSISKIQTIIKNSTRESRLHKVNAHLEKSPLTIELFAVIRGTMLRKSLKQIQQNLKENVNQIIRLQSAMRGSLAREYTQYVLAGLARVDLIPLQSLVRKRLFHQKHTSNVKSSHDGVSLLQAIARGNRARGSLFAFRKQLKSHSHKELQSIARGGITRNRLNHILDVLYFEEPTLLSLVSIVRGSLSRGAVSRLKKNLQKTASSTIRVQSVFRGVLTRFSQEMFIDTLIDHSSEIIELQSVIRGKDVRLQREKRLQHFMLPANLKKIIKLQSYIRASKQGSAYKSLINQPSPSLRTVQRFIHLLSDSDLDFEEELSIARGNELIVRKKLNISKLEEHLNQLDVKISLLMKNKITIDELVRHKSKHMMSKEKTVSIAKDPIPTGFEKYGKLFHLLQTKPQYLCRLFEVIDQNNLEYDLDVDDNIESIVMKAFSISDKFSQREEFLLMKLVICSYKGKLDRISSLEEFKRTTKADGSVKYLLNFGSVWELVLNSFNNLAGQRVLLRKVFANRVLTLIENDDLDLECQPRIIYERLILQEEKSTNQPSKKIPALEVSHQDAIEDPETRHKFVENLSSLREVANEFLLLIESNINAFPLHMRCLCQELYRSLSERFPNESERFYLSCVGKVFMKNYFLPLLLTPENYGIQISNSLVPKPENKKVRGNLIQLAKVLFQMCSMRAFGTSNLYLQPLNPFIEQSVEPVRRVLNKLIDVGSIDTSYGMNAEYDDIVSVTKATLSIKGHDLSNWEKILQSEIQVISPLKSDSMAICVESLKGPKRFQDDDTVSFALSSVIEDQNQNEINTKLKTLYLQVKRGIVYIMQTQLNGEDLLDLLIAKISPEDEKTFQAIVRDVSKPTAAYNDALAKDDAFNNMEKMTFHRLKKLTLEKVLELESHGEITRTNCFQDILNEIAHDIKNKHQTRVSRSHQLSVINSSLDRLREREKQLSQESDSYNADIEKAMLNLQSNSQSHKKKFWRQIFSRHYYYHRELKRKNGAVPKFGSYKYSSKHLYDSGVLLDVSVKSDSTEFSASGSKALAKLDFLLSSNDVGQFSIEVANGINVIPAGVSKVSIDDLLKLQYEKTKSVKLCGGMAEFDCNALIALIFRKFYEVKE